MAKKKEGKRQHGDYLLCNYMEDGSPTRRKIDFFAIGEDQNKGIVHSFPKDELIPVDSSGFTSEHINIGSRGSAYLPLDSVVNDGAFSDVVIRNPDSTRDRDYRFRVLSSRIQRVE